MRKKLRNGENPTGSQKQKGLHQMEVNSKAGHSDESFETCSCLTNVCDALLTYLNASSFLNYALLNLYLAISLASPETTSETEAVIALFTIIQDPYFDAHLISI